MLADSSNNRTDPSLASQAQERRLRMTAFVVPFLCLVSWPGSENKSDKYVHSVTAAPGPPCPQHNGSSLCLPARVHFPARRSSMQVAAQAPPLQTRDVSKIIREYHFSSYSVILFNSSARTIQVQISLNSALSCISLPRAAFCASLGLHRPVSPTGCGRFRPLSSHRLAGLSYK